MRKFAFETEFASDGTVVRAAPAHAPRRMTPEEIESERQAAYAQGKDDAAAAAERANAKAVADLAGQAGLLLKRLDAESAAMRAEAATLALAVARKIADAALVAYGEERALAAIESVLDGLRHGPRLIVRVSPASADALKPRIEEMSATHQYPGAIIVRVDAALGAGAVSIDWAEGVVTLDPKNVSARIDALVSAALAGGDAGANP